MLEQLTWYRQSSYLWRGEVTVYVDPWGVPDGEPGADFVFITHAHADHFSPDDIKKVSSEGTIFVAPHDIAEQLAGDVRAVRPGEQLEVAGVGVEAIPAYNVQPGRLDKHPRDNDWVGYVLTLDGTRYLFAGDTDHTPELTGVRTDVAVVPVGGTFTMDAAEAATAVKEMGPRLAVPYHYGFVVGSESDGHRFVEAIAPIEGRIMTPVYPFAR
ncbi:MAG TPA: MBL fold metallo-hydrolase [Actinomycetota bacterium]